MKKSSLALGLPTVVNLLVLLLFACVSMLSLSRAQADYMTASHGQDVSSDYFAADAQAQILLGSLEQAASLEPDLAGFEMESILNEQGIAARYEQQTRLLSFSVPAGEAGSLSVGLTLLDSGGFEITAWQLIPHEEE